MKLSNLFNRRTSWKTPGGTFPLLYDDMAKQPHLLIAGATGSGKSVVINGIVSTLLCKNSPSKVQFILIDPKRVELSLYRNLPHVLRYASEPGEPAEALRYALSITDKRYKQAQAQGTRKYDGPDLYIIIDELADLMTTDKRNIKPLLQRLCQIGRAAKVHVIAATQCPLATVIPTEIKCNFDSRVGLRTRSAQDSRNILGESGLETLPRYGQGVYMTPEETDLWEIPLVPDAEQARLVAWWTGASCKVPTAQTA